MIWLTSKYCLSVAFKWFWLQSMPSSANSAIPVKIFRQSKYALLNKYLNDITPLSNTFFWKNERKLHAIDLPFAFISIFPLRAISLLLLSLSSCLTTTLLKIQTPNIILIIALRENARIRYEPHSIFAEHELTDWPFHGVVVYGRTCKHGDTLVPIVWARVWHPALPDC